MCACKIAYLQHGVEERKNVCKRFEGWVGACVQRLLAQLEKRCSQVHLESVRWFRNYFE